MRFIHKFLWLTHIPRALKIDGANGSHLSLAKIKKISLCAWLTSFVLLAANIFVIAYASNYLSATQFFFFFLLPTVISFTITYFTNGFYYGSLFFIISGSSLEVHDWKLIPGKAAAVLERDFFACLGDVLSSGATDITVKSHLFGKIDQKRLERLIERKFKKYGRQNLNYEILPHTPINPLSRMLMFLMQIPERSSHESGFKIILGPAS